MTCKILYTCFLVFYLLQFSSISAIFAPFLLIGNYTFSLIFYVKKILETLFYN